MTPNINRLGLVLVILSLSAILAAQNLENLALSTSSGLEIHKLILSDSSEIDLDGAFPVFSFELNGKYRQSGDVPAVLSGTRFILSFEKSLRVTFASFGGGHPGWKGEITFLNEGTDTLVISNVVPFGENPDNVYICGKGPWNLARAWLHRPAYKPVRVILPDNAWEAAYSSWSVSDDLAVCSLIRRGKAEGALVKRYNTELPPGSRISYNYYGETYSGEWQEGLRRIFRDRYMYDLFEFDNSLFEREDLKWISESYLIALQFAWDRNFYDRLEGKYKFGDFLRSMNEKFSYLDVYGLWPTWPRLGLDQRNQWDMYTNLPGGTTQIRNFSRLARNYNTRFFIAYNPWDRSTRQENPMAGMSRLIGEIEADGVVLDTRGASSFELQQAADSVREGVVMYSEGMAVPSDMPGIVSGRVHNAIYLSPELNLNKLIKPEFAIFRVCDVGEDVLHREIAISFFNGYGTELNLFRPGRDFNIEDDYDFLARTTMILRENSDVFLDRDWTPLVDTRKDGIYINRWGKGAKVLYTVLSMTPAGFNEPMIEIADRPGFHYVSLWNHENILPVRLGNRFYLPVSVKPYSSLNEGTRREGEVDCIARFTKLLESFITNDTLRITSEKPGTIRIYRGNPSYGAEKVEMSIGKDTAIYLPAVFGSYEGKVLVQLHIENKLADVNILRRTGKVPWLVSAPRRTEGAGRVPRDMVLIPPASFSYTVSANDNFIPHPVQQKREVELDSFLIDRYPVTNLDYYKFVFATSYYPADTANYLKHWENGIYRQGQEDYPVVYISLEDARAYAEWVGKRLPAEDEWQLAAQGTDGRIWPWGNEFHGTKCNNSFNRSTPVDAFPKGESPFGVFDLVGNVWQLTDDVYSNGTNYFVTIRGGSYYKPDSSWWYIEGGPQPLNKTQMLLMVSPGFDRSSTVGFRCVKDF